MKNDKQTPTLDELFKYFCEAEFPMHIQNGIVLKGSLEDAIRKAFYTGFIEAIDRYSQVSIPPEERELVTYEFLNYHTEFHKFREGSKC